MTVTIDSVLSPGSPRMYLGGTVGPDFIPYTLSAVVGPTPNAAPGNGNYVNATFTGSVLGTSYQNAKGGTYTDTVRVTLTY
jgi:spore coat protein U-like protein